MTATVQPATTSAPTASRRVRRWARLMAVAAAVVAAVAVWVVAEVAFAVDLQAPAFDGSGRSFDIGVGQVVFTVALASFAGWGLVALLERLTTRAHTIWAVVATVTLLVSLSGPLSGTGATAANRAALLAMHLVVAAVLIPMLYRTSTRTALTSPQDAGAEQ